MPQNTNDFLDYLENFHESDYFNFKQELVDKKDPQDIKKIKGSLRIVKVQDPTHITVLAISKDPLQNYSNNIATDGGIPIGGYTFDSLQQCYSVFCSNSLELGFIPVSFIAQMSHVSNWEIRIPMPATVIKKYLSIKQNDRLKEFCGIYKDHKFEFLQMLIP